MKTRPILIAMLVLSSVAAAGLAVLTRDLTGAITPVGAPVVEAAAQRSTLPPDQTLDLRFRSCAHCHQIGPGARNMSGPVLTNLIGRKAASTDYSYSNAMRTSGIMWDKATLRRFLKSPQSVVPGTRMAFGGVKDEELDRLIDFLETVR